MRQRSVLVIENDADIQAVTKFSLEMDGHWQVNLANCGKEGLLKAQHLWLDLILLDSIALDAKNLEILEQLKTNKNTQKVPIILFTTRLLSLKQLAYQNNNVVGIIYKPFDCLTLSDKILNILARKDRSSNYYLTSNH